MNIVISLIVVPVIIGVFASFIVWYLPTERFNPSGRLVSYNQHYIEEDFVDSKGSARKRQMIKRNIHITNNSPKFAMYNITCFFEFLDSDNNIVYHEDKQQAYSPANTTEEHPLIIPFKSLPLSKIEQWKPIKIKMFLIYENRYGTKKISGPWWIREYDTGKTTFEPKLDN